MNLKDEIVKLFDSKEPKRYVYLSKSKANMDALNIHVSENVDLDNTKTSVYVVQPIGIAKIVGEVSGVFVDKGCTSTEHIKKFLTLTDPLFIIWVEPSTMELIKDDKSN